MKRDITFGINGRQETLNVDDGDTLLEVLPTASNCGACVRAVGLERAGAALYYSTAGPSVHASSSRFAQRDTTS